MNNQNSKTSTNYIFKRLSFLKILCTLSILVLFTACASVSHRDKSIHSILQKENELIEKLQAERTQPEIVRAVSNSEDLRRAEAHLALVLEELLSANETIKTKILKVKKKEDESEQN